MASVLSGFDALAATINVGPADGYAKIEAAQAGDEVVLAPGTYTFRLHLTGMGTPSSPIVIRAQDPKNPPVFDFGTTLVENAPGSYTAGDKGRACWQFDGASSYRVSGIVFQNCSTAGHNSAGIRYYNGSKDLYVKDAVFRKNDNGLTGGSQDSEMTVEWSEFDSNGNNSASTSSPTHNIYVYGGTFALRYSYVHDPLQAENFHIRAHDSTLEYNWFARGQYYEGDLMTDDDYSGTGTLTQTMLFRGNVIVQGMPQNHGQIIALFNDGGAAGLTLAIKVINNTVISANPHAALVHLSNADQTTMTAEIDNNILGVSDTPYLIEDTAHGTVTGQNDWLLTGSTVGPLMNNTYGSDPGLDPALRPTATSSVISKAGIVSGAPDKEYFYDEKTTRQYRLRSTVKDIGAFESTTMGSGTGPYDTPPVPGGDGGVTGDGGADGGGPSLDGGDGGLGNGTSGQTGGCGCGVAGLPTTSAMGAGLALAALLLARVRRRAVLLAARNGEHDRHP
jgi:hypothetical protein